MTVSLQNQRRRGWVAFSAGAFLAVFVTAIWVWVDRLMAGSAGEPGAAAFLGRLNVAFALLAVSGVLGAINGWIMAQSGRRNITLIVLLLLCFVVALFIAWTASSAYHPG